MALVLASFVLALTSWRAPAAHAQACDLTIGKSADPDEVAEGSGDEITYTIVVTNNDDEVACTNVEVTEDIPADTTCVSVDSSGDVGVDDDAAEENCDDNDDITWTLDDDLAAGEEVELELVVSLDDDAAEGDEIDNEACVDAANVEQECDTATVDVVEAEEPTATATVQVVPTATRQPTVQPPPAPTLAPPAPVPTARIVAPVTGSGPDSFDYGPVALVLGIAGGALLAGVGVARMRRAR